MARAENNNEKRKDETLHLIDSRIRESKRLLEQALQYGKAPNLDLIRFAVAELDGALAREESPEDIYRREKVPPPRGKRCRTKPT